MKPLLIRDIGILAGIHPEGTAVLQGSMMANLPVLNDAWLLCANGFILDFGNMNNIPTQLPPDTNIFSVNGGAIFPSWCDSHSHIVFAASREEEFVMKIKGKSYEEIAANGGGILNSAEKMQTADESELYDAAFARLNDMIGQGTGALEIKSGYGLTLESELKMLRVIKRLKENSPIPIKATLLAAHTYPLAYKESHQAYISMIVEELLPAVYQEGLADYFDVFCEKGFFSVEETDQLLAAAAHYGLKPKIHANQLSVSGGVEIALKHKAISVDHLEATDALVIGSMTNHYTIATLLPSCSLFLRIPYANARGLIDANIPVAIASDYNPGSTPSGNMNLVVSLACINLRMLPEESINAATINGAAAMELGHELGSITKGKRANFFITRTLSSIAFLPYSFGQSQIEHIVLNGEFY
ncbi:imidazolonepropionase [Pedobacter duraquae]|uniref:Imidazolonepropionase n=1 Tax=Pedobacter duraquae TaxID=425511 RepID=A0A4R6IE66_9SPHI|nr:imidazolonepropionase [Pedobacter duraquae]TDO19205.1 imidazolonepropionase [Pedobacter duraquae]